MPSGQEINYKYIYIYIQLCFMNNLILNLKIFINLLINKNSNIFKLLLFFFHFIAT